MAINLTDFDKIWASSSPLTPYSFSDANYEEGWNFVGSTPPARQMWDSIQKNNDEKLKYIVDNFLPLAGGTMTGNNARITMSNGESYIISYSNGLYLNGTDGSYNSNLVLYTTSNASGFMIQAGDGANRKRLEGKPNGTLTWDSKNITVHSNIASVSITENTTYVTAIGNNQTCCRCGCVVTLGLNFQIAANVPSSTVIFTNCPKPYGKMGFCGVAGSQGQRLILDTDGSIRTDGNGPSSAQYLNACITYISNT